MSVTALFQEISALTVVGVALVVYLVTGAAYRLYFSPIAKFPGPKLAAVTLWYEFYYDVYLRGQYLFKIRKLHEEYGSIIRISLYELYIETPSYYEELFAGSGQKRNKYEWWTKQFATLDAEVDKLISRVQGFRDSSEPLTISLAYTAFSSDLLSEYAFGRSYHRLDHKDFDPAYARAIHEGVSASHFNKQFIWPFKTLIALPPWLGTSIAPGLSMYVSFIRDCEVQIRAIKEGRQDTKAEGSHPTIFHDLLQNPNLPESEKSINRLVQEGQVIVSAGTETTASCLSIITFHLLSNPDVLRRLRAELEIAIPDLSEPPDLTTLEQLPYLIACVQEGLRLSYGLSSRLARICPDKPMIFNDGKKDWEIPAGTPASMTTYLIHHNETIFPNSYEYIPERWLDNPRLDRYLLSFNKGTRGCVGINLAYADMYLCLAAIFWRYGISGEPGPEGELQLYQTTKDDVEMAADMFIPFVKEGSKGIRVLVKK